MRMSSLVAQTLGAFLLLACSASAETLDVTTALTKLGFPANTVQKVIAGRFVETPLSNASERDLNLGIAFLAKKTPAVLRRDLLEKMLLPRLTIGTLLFGTLEGDDAPELRRLNLTHAQLAAYPAAAPGSALNLSTEEIATLRAVGTEGPAVQAAVQDLLRARYRAYRTNGLAGIAPYARKDGSRDVAADLVAINRAARAKAILPAEFYDLLDGYPKVKPADLVETYSWALFHNRGSDVITLTHAFSGMYAGIYVIGQRQFYASTGYNAEQAIAGFVPVTEGTLVVYTNHTSTDQVAGVGANAKRGIGRKLMATDLLEVFKRVDAAR